MIAPSYPRLRGTLTAVLVAGLAAAPAPLAAQTSAERPTQPKTQQQQQQEQERQNPQPAPQQGQAPPSAPVTSRAEQIIQEQAARTLTVGPYQKNGFEKTIDIAEDLILDPPTVYPWFGSIFPGGLFALGGGIRKPYGDTGLFDMHAGWSFRNYTGVAATLKLPELAGGRIKPDVHGQFVNAPRVAFHGLGQDSAEDATHFLYRPTTAGVGLTIAPVKVFSIGGAFDYLDVHTGAAKRGTSIEQRFTQLAAPGLGTSPTYLRTRASAGIDWRDSPGYTRRGGLYQVDWYDYRQRNDGPFSFQRADAEIQQFLPILHGNWVLAFRGLVSTTETDAGDQVPYFLMPDLGGSSSLRGYPSWRFRDRHRMLISGEYRWMAGHFVDMALFVDAGKVTSRRRDLDLSHLESTYGIGVRFHTPAATVLRIELAKTREGLGLVFTAGPSF